MSSVDMVAVEEAMKMASLDTLKGYNQNHYGEVRQYATPEYIPYNQALGFQVLREPMWNKGKHANFSFPSSCSPLPTPLFQLPSSSPPPLL